MVKEAEANAAEDARRREEIEVRNQTDALVYSTERALAEHGSTLSPAERSAVERALSEAKDALGRDDLNRVRRAQANLQRAADTLADAIQRQPSSAGQPQEGEIVDAELVDDRSS